MVYTKEMLTFLEKMEISKEDFEKSGVSWKALKRIKRAYLDNTKFYEKIALSYVEELSKLENVHSVRYRIKDVNHLLEKIIRKTLDGEKDIDYENFAEKITDIVGIRVLYVFKSDWKKLHDDINKQYSKKYAQNPQVKIKDGDSEEEFKSIRNVVVEKNVYRSIHYTLRHDMYDESTGDKICTVKVEIQTRSIFEEGWSEINHKLIYKKSIPDEIKDKMYNISDILATLAGACDRLGESLKDYEIEAKTVDQKFPNKQQITVAVEKKEVQGIETSSSNENEITSAAELIDIMESYLDIPVQKTKTKTNKQK